MIMANNNIPLHQEDDIVLNQEFDFSNSMFDLNETVIPKLSNNFSTPSNEINLKFKNYDNLAKLAHVNARSIPMHIHEIDKIITETKLDILGVSETFISENTPLRLAAAEDRAKMQ